MGKLAIGKSVTGKLATGKSVIGRSVTGKLTVQTKDVQNPFKQVVYSIYEARSGLFSSSSGRAKTSFTFDLCHHLENALLEDNPFNKSESFNNRSAMGFIKNHFNIFNTEFRIYTHRRLDFRDPYKRFHLMGQGHRLDLAFVQADTPI